MSRPKYSIGHRLLTGLLAWTVLSIAATPTYAQEARQRFDIPAQAASDALNAFSRQSGLRLLFPFEAVAGKQTQALSGELTAEEALEKLLAGSDLTFEITSSSVVLIREKAATKTGRDAAAQPSFMLAQNDERAAQTPQATPPASASQSTPESAQREEKPKNGMQLVDLGEVVVTGTHIRGAGAVGSNVIVIDRQAIDASGHATVQDVLQALPQNFGGGPNEDNRSGREALSNFVAQGSAINLRGLSAASTLVLVNGRRQAGSGDNGAFVDVSSIPTTAIERIEVLTDGASAIYGSDAVGGVVNFILLDDYEGMQTRVRYSPDLGSDTDDLQLGQVLGTSWSTGHALLTYEYYERSALANADREFTRDADLRRFGGDDFRSTISNPGNIISFLTFQPAFAIPPGQDGTSLTVDDLLPGANRTNQLAFRDQLPSQERHSAFATVSQKITDGIELFAEARYGERDYAIRIGQTLMFAFVPPSNPFYVNPFGPGPVFVFYDATPDFGPARATGGAESVLGSAGTNVRLGADWRVNAYGTYGEQTENQTQEVLDFGLLGAALADSNPATAFNVFGDGSHTNPATIESLRDSVTLWRRSSVQSYNVIADGPLFALRGGSASLAVGSEYREERLKPGRTASELDRNVTAAFGELFFPVVSAANARSGLARLEFSAAVRYEDYSDFGTTTNPKVGFAWAPVASLALRGTYGTSFRAPTLRDLDISRNSVDLAGLPDPSSPFGFTTVLLWDGNNAGLLEQTADIWTLGLDFAPSQIANLRAGLNYFDIEYQDRIANPDNIPLVLLEPERFSSIITRNPTQAQLDAVCGSGDQLRFDPALCNPSVIQAIVDGRLHNTSLTTVRGVDFDVSYGLDAHAGAFAFGLSGTYLFEWSDAFSPSAPTVDLVSQAFQPIDLRLRGSLSWNHGAFGAGLFVNYLDNSVDRVSQPNRKVDSWTTLDMQLRYDFGRQLEGLTASLSAINVLDEDPPFLNHASGIAYDAANADPRGRIMSLQVTKSW